MPNINLAPYDSRQQAIDRRRALAAALQQQAYTPIETPPVAGALISPWQGVAKIAQAIAGQYQQRKLDKKQTELDKETQAQRLSQALGLIQSQVPGITPERAQALAQGLTSQDPMLARFGMLGVESAMPKPGEGFSLSPGQTRFDAQGNPIANIPVSEPVAKSPEGFVLSPGQTRFDAEGKPIANLPATPPKPDEPSEQEKILNGIYYPIVAANKKVPVEALTPQDKQQAFEMFKRASQDPTMMGLQNAIKEMQQQQLIFQRTQGLRDDYTKRTQDDFTRMASYEAINSIKDQPAGGPSDIVLLYNFVKLQDPNAVREGEIQLVQQGAAIPDRWKLYVNKFLRGGVLAPEQRKQMIAEADNLVRKSIQPRIEKANKDFEATAKRFQVDPVDVIKPVESVGDTDPLGLFK